MSYIKPQVSIDLEEYNELVARSKIGQEYTDKNHVYNYPDDLLDFLKANVISKLYQTETPDKITFRMNPRDSSITILNNNSWLLTNELIELINNFTTINISTIAKLRIAYITGMQSPFGLNSKVAMAHVGDYYEVHCRIKYRN